MNLFTKSLMLLLMINLRLSISDDSTTAAQQCLQGQLQLTKAGRFCSYLCKSEYKLKLLLYESNNESYKPIAVNTASKSECNICTDPYQEENCMNKECDLSQFECTWRNHGCYSFPSPTSTSTSQAVYQTTTMASQSASSQSAGHIEISIMALGTIIGLLGLLVVLLIAGWIWTCWIMKKRATKSSRMNNRTGQNQHSNGHSTLHSYENNTLDKDVPMTKFQSSATYSLLTLDKETNTATEGERTANGNNTYSLLDRSCGKTKTTARQREQVDGYSRLFSN